MDPANLLVLVLLAAFAIDRASHAIVYAISLTGVLNSSEAKDSASHPSPRRSTVLYFIIASALSILFLICWRPLPVVGLLPASKISTATAEILDYVFTFILLVGGSDGISTVLDSSFKTPAEAARRSESLVVRGEVTVREGPKV